MSNETFKVKKGLTLTPVDPTTLSSPQAGDLVCDSTDDNKIKRYDSTSSTWVEVGSGSGGGTTDVDVLSVDTYDSATTGDYTQTGLTFNTVTPIHGTQSAQLIHQAGSSQSYKKTIDVDRKFRGQLCELSLNVRSTATDGNVTLLVTDETNAVTIAASQSVQTSSVSIASLTITNGVAVIGGFSNSDINSLEVGMAVTGTGIQTNTVINSINTSTNSVVISQTATSTTTTALRFSAVPTTRTFSFEMPSNCASFSYTITALQESGSPQTTIDDAVVKLASVSLLETSVEVPVVTSWQAYTPTFTGFGTPSNVSFKWRQVGDSVEIAGHFINGTPTAVTAQMSLPNGYSVDTTKVIGGQNDNLGTFQRSTNATTSFPATTLGPFAVTFSSSVSASTLLFSFQSANGTTYGIATGSGISAAGDHITITAKVPVLGLSATETVAIPLTQSGLIQEADFALRASTNAGTSVTASVTDIPYTVASTVGTAAGAWNGSQFTVLEDGIFSITGTFLCSTTAFRVALLYKNGVYYKAIGDNTSSTIHSYAITDKFSTGDVLSIRSNTTSTLVAASSSESHVLTITHQGSLKQVNVNTNSKIKIPTSELRFEGASARGAVATAIIKFDTQAKIRGDAFTVTNTTNDGTYVTMTKAGRVSINCSVNFSTTTQLSLSKNQAILTAATPAASELLNGIYHASAVGMALPVSWTGDVVVGDVIRVVSNNTPSASVFNTLNLSFQEQDISVSVTNTLPQFSESDSSVRVDTANGYGSTGTKIRRFSNTRDNIGTDIVYTDSATNGASFTVMTSGIYNISYSDNFTSASDMGISKNVSSLSTNWSLLTAAEQLAGSSSANPNYNDTVAWTGYLVAGDVVRPHNQGLAVGTGNPPKFTISKVGKPNVTGVDVTPFVNIPQPDISEVRIQGASARGAVATSIIKFDTVTTSYGSGLSVTNTTNDGTYITVLKAGNLAVSYNLVGSGVCSYYITRNQSVLTGGTGPGANEQLASGSGVTAPYHVSASWDGKVYVGDVIRVSSNAISPAASGINNFNFYLESPADTILTAPQTFSTDTAGLVYAGSGTYTLSTLANAPVGTFITFTYAASTNTRTQTTTAPTQTTADMNTNGILIYSRPYNAASTAAQPTSIAIQIGKGLKGKHIELYKSTGKATNGSIDLYGASGTTGQTGLACKEYNESTGILFLDAGLNYSSAVTTANFLFTDTTSQASGYVVINASTNPALTGMNIGKVMARGISTSGQSIPNTSTYTTITLDAAKTFDTHGALNAATGVFTAPETGYYQVSWSAFMGDAVYAVGNFVQTILYKNGAAEVIGSYYEAEAAVTTIVSSNGDCCVYLVKGNTLDVRIAHNRSGGANVLNTTANANFFSIAKVSN